MKVPFPSLDDWEGGAFVFTHWLPLDPADALEVEFDNGCSVRMWFDLQCAWWASQTQKEEIPAHVNLNAHYVMVDVVVRKVDQALLAHIRAGSPSGLTDGALSQLYWELGERVYRAVTGSVNRLIAYGRATKGQYWLRPLPVDTGVMSSEFVRWRASAWLGHDGPFEWRPSRMHHMTLTLEDEERYVNRAEWGAIRDFVRSEARTPLVGELLSNAEDLASRGYGRSAVVDAVAALEVGLGRITDDNLASIRWKARFGSRVPAEEFRKHIEHLGLSNTVRYLLPLVMDDMSDGDLVTVLEAVQARQTVVHEGQRAVDTTEAKRYIRAIRVLCEHLRTQGQ